MRVLAVSTTGASVDFSADEALLLNNPLNEVLHGISDLEVQTRLGIAPSEAERLLKEFGTLLDKISFIVAQRAATPSRT